MANATDFKVKRGLVVSTTATILSTVNATSTTTGGLIVSGGAGIAKDLFVAGTISAVNTTSALVVKSNISMVSPDAASTITIRMLNSDAISFSGNSGQLFSITDSMTGTIFAVNDISGIPSIEVYDTGEVRLAETFGYVRIPNATSATSTVTGALRVDGGVGIGGDLYVGGTVFATTMVGTFTGTASTSTNLSSGATGSIPYQTSVGRTSFIGIGSIGQILQSNGTTATWVSTGSLIAGTAFTATTLLGGTAGQIHYQSAPGVTAFAGPGTAGQVLVSAGTSAPVYTNTASIYVGNATRVDTLRQTANATYYPTFVDANNASAATEIVYTTSSFVINPSTGNVGIGTSSPNALLHISGPNFPLARIERVTSQTAGPTRSTFSVTHRTTADMTNGFGPDISFSIIDSSGVDNEVGLFGVIRDGADNSGAFQFRTYSAGVQSEKLRITATGNIGINTASPESKLHVTGDARITGITTVSNTTAVSSTITGAFQVAGGIGVGGGMFVGGTVTATNFFGSFNGTVSTATSILTSAQTANATYYPGFVDANNASSTAELVYTTSSFAINPSSGDVSIKNVVVTGYVTATSALSIYSGGTNQDILLLPSGTGQVRSTTDIIAIGNNYNSGTKAFKFQRVENKAAIWSVPLGSFGQADIRFTTGGTAVSTAKTEADATVRIAPAGGVAIGNTYLAQNPADGILLVSSNIGVGTVSPASKLHVAGDARITGITTVTNTTAVTSTITGAFQVAGGIGVGGGMFVGGIVTVSNTTAVSSTITGAFQVAGGVGIGGGLVVGGIVTATTFVGSFNGTVSTATSILTSAQTANATYYPTFVDANNATASAELVYTTSSFVINPSTGYIGLGAASPTQKLDVRGKIVAQDSYPTIYVNHNGTIIGGIRADALVALELKTITTAPISLQVNNSEKVRITDSGNVGIGTVSPASLLHVAGDARITGITTVTNNTAASSTITGAFQVVGGAGIGGNVYIGGNEVVTGTLQVNSTNANTATNTSNALYTAGGAWIDKTLVVGGDTTFKGSVVFQGTNTFVYSSSTVYTDNLISLHAPSGSTPGSHTWTVDDGKDIGFLFHYYKGADRDAFLGFANDTQYLEWYSNGVESGGVFTGTTYGIFKTGGIRLVGGESNSGNTTTGSLQVLGGVGISGGVFVGGTVTATSFVGSFNGSIVGAATQVNTVQQTANATYYPTFVDSNNVSAGGESVYTTSSFVINPSTGNVGIGNTTPLYKLHVNTAATVGTAASVLSNSTPILYLDSGAAANGAIVIKSHSVGNNNVHGAVKFASSPDASNYSWSGIAGVADANGAASNLVFYTATGNAQATSAGASTERMRLDINGNLGIGATPASRLHIEGASVATNIIATSGNGIIRLGSSVSGANRKEFTTILDTTNNRVDLQAVWQGITTLPITINAGGGNVGIGLTAPASLLHVAGDARITGITTVTNNTVASSTITGAFQVVGGAGIGGALFVGGSVNISSGVVSTNTGTGALIVNGGVGINGALNAITKSFNIGHPTKPGMTLRYGSLEGPEFGVYVRGRLKGSNTIELPEYWTKLVDPDTITVNLTPVGSHQKLYVEDIVNNTIIVGNENIFGKAIDCFYTVYAERADIDKLEVESE